MGASRGRLFLESTTIDLHIAGNLPDKHPVAPFLNDKGEIILTGFAGSIPAEFAGAGIDREGGCPPAFAGGAEAGGVLVDRNIPPHAAGGGGGGFGYTESIRQAIAVGVESGRVMAELLAHAARIQGRVEHHRRGVGQQGRIDQNRGRHIKRNVL